MTPKELALQKKAQEKEANRLAKTPTPADNPQQLRARTQATSMAPTGNGATDLSGNNGLELQAQQQRMAREMSGGTTTTATPPLGAPDVPRRQGPYNSTGYDNNNVYGLPKVDSNINGAAAGDVASYKAVGDVYRNPDRTNEDVLRGISTRVNAGNAVRSQQTGEAPRVAVTPENTIQSINQTSDATRSPGPTGFFDSSPNADTFEQQYANMSPGAQMSALRDRGLAATVRPMATMEQRYEAQGIEPPRPAKEPSIWGFLGEVGRAFNPSGAGLAGNPTAEKAAGFANHLVGFANDPDAQRDLKRTVNDVDSIKAPAGIRALDRFGRELGETTKRLLGGADSAIENYADGGEFKATPNQPTADRRGVIDRSGAGAEDEPNQPTADRRGVSDRSGAGAEGSTRADGSAPLNYYTDAQGNAFDTPGAGRTLQQGGTGNVSYVSDEAFQRNGLREGGSTGFPQRTTISGGRGTDQPFTITRPDSRIGMSDAQIAAKADQVRARLAQRRLGGGSASGGNVLRDINRINQQAQKTFNDVRNKTGNSQAAERAANVIRGQADDLIRGDRNSVQREGDQLQADVYRERISADQDYRAQSLTQEAAALFSDMSEQQQKTLTEDAQRIARGKATDADDPEGEAAQYETLWYANVPKNYGQLDKQGQAEAAQYATAATDFVLDINDRNPLFQYTSMSDLLAGADKAISGGRLNQEEAKFWAGVFREGPWDGLRDWFSGAGVITLPGTDIKATTKRIENFRAMSRDQQRDHFNRVSR